MLAPTIARLVVELGQSPPPVASATFLRGLCGDPELVLAYPLADSGRVVDAQGHTTQLPREHEHTSLMQDGRPVAVIAHRRGVLDNEQLVEEVTAAARLALENERLQAEVRARLEDLRASRARIVCGRRPRASAPRARPARRSPATPRRPLPVTPSRPHAEHPGADQLARAEQELQLGDRGASGARARDLSDGARGRRIERRGVHALAEEARVPLRVHRPPPTCRFDEALEVAAFTVVAETVAGRDPGASPCAGRGGPWGAWSFELEAAGSERPRRRRARGSPGRPRRPIAGRAGGGGRRRGSGGAAVRVVIADDETLLGEGLERLLVEAGLEVAARRVPRTSCSAAWSSRPRRRDRRHQDAADPDGRGPCRRAGDPPPTRDRCPRSVALRRIALRDAPARGAHQRSGYLLKERISDVAILDDVAAVATRRAPRRSTRRSSAPARPAWRAETLDELPEHESRGARPHGGGPLERGHLTAASISARRPSRRTSGISS